MTYNTNDTKEAKYQREYINRLSFDECMAHNEWIVLQFEKLLDLV